MENNVTPSRPTDLQYVYKVIDTKTGEYYFGSSFCDIHQDPENDGYYGSGPTWEDISRLDKLVILKGFKTIEARIAAENAFIERFISDPLCLNNGTQHPTYHCYGITRTLSEEHKRKVSENHARYWKGKARCEEFKRKIRKPILQFTKDGEFIREWESMKLAGETLNIQRGDISSTCTGRLKSAGGFIWKHKQIK